MIIYEKYPLDELLQQEQPLTEATAPVLACYTFRQLHRACEARDAAYRARADQNDCSSIIAQYGQWAVTRYGVESLDHAYAIGAAHLREDWLEHMLEKNWVVPLEFLRALRYARRYHQQEVAHAAAE